MKVDFKPQHKANISTDELLTFYGDWPADYLSERDPRELWYGGMTMQEAYDFTTDGNKRYTIRRSLVKMYNISKCTMPEFNQHVTHCQYPEFNKDETAYVIICDDLGNKVRIYTDTVASAKEMSHMAVRHCKTVDFYRSK